MRPFRLLFALCAAFAAPALVVAPACAQAVGPMGQPYGTPANGSAPPRAGGVVSVTPSQPASPPQFGTAQQRPPVRAIGPSQSFPAPNAPAGWMNGTPNAPTGWTNAPTNGPTRWPGSGLRPIGPATQNGPIGQTNAPTSRGFGGGTFSGTERYLPSRPVRVTTPVGPQTLPGTGYYNPYPVYGGSGVTVVTGGPVLLGGYYYGNYCDNGFGPYSFPAIYSGYDGFPQYIYSPGVVVLSQPYSPVYDTGYLPFSPPAYPVTYNQNNYYVSSPQTADDIEQGGEKAHHALQTAAPEGSYQAAFADIERAWQDGNMGLLSRHLRDNDTKLSVFLKGKYSYSIAAGDFTQITRDAFDRLQTASFRFNRLRKAKNGDVTAYGKHVYHVRDGSGDAVPFSTDNPSLYDDKASDPAVGTDKTVYVSYTLRHQDSQWNIIALDSSPTDLAK